MFSDIVMSSKTVSNKSGFWALIAIFVGQGILVGLIVIVLGLTKALDPFVLTSYEYGLVIEGVVLTAFGIIGGITTPMAWSNHQGPD